MYPPQASRLNMLYTLVSNIITLLDCALVPQREDAVSSCTACSWTRPNGICFPVPRTVGCTIGRLSTLVYSTRLPFSASGRIGSLLDNIATVDFRSHFVFSCIFCPGRDTKHPSPGLQSSLAMFPTRTVERAFHSRGLAAPRSLLCACYRRSVSVLVCSNAYTCCDPFCKPPAILNAVVTFTARAGTKRAMLAVYSER